MALTRKARVLLAAAAGVVASLVLIDLSISPSNDRDWSPDQALLPTATFEGRSVHVRNVRNVVYRSTTDFTPGWFDRTYDLDRLESLWFMVEPFGAWEGPAHTLLSFGFAGGDHLAVSVEIRKEKGEAYSAVKGLLRQYELTYVVGSEADLIGLRAVHRGHDVFLYPVNVGKPRIERLFVSMMRRANALAARPEFYNTLTNTCTTNIVRHMNEVADRPVSPWRLSVLLPGRSDRLAYDLGLLDASMPFDEARRAFNVSARARRAAGHADFSSRIREVVPRDGPMVTGAGRP